MRPVKLEQQVMNGIKSLNLRFEGAIFGIMGDDNTCCSGPSTGSGYGEELEWKR